MLLRNYLALLALAIAHTSNPISITNDLINVAHANLKYRGLKNSEVYIDGKLLESGQTIQIYNPKNKYTLKISMEPDIARELGSKYFLIPNFVFKIFKFYLHITFKTEKNAQTITVVDVLREKDELWKKQKPSYQVSLRGIFKRSITVYIDDNQV